MDIIKMNASLREESGKGPSNRLRRAGQIPAIAYGRDLAARPVAISPKALLKVLGSDHGQNSVLELNIEGGDTLTVMVRDYSYHPITRELVHADFVAVKLDQPVEIEVPLRLIGKAKGVALGGILQQIYRRIPVRSLPEKIPSVIELDITELDVGDSLKAGALTMPEGVTIRLSDDKTVAVVNAPEKEEVVEALPGAEVAGVPGAPGAPAAPGAPGAAGAPGAPGAPAAAGAAPAAAAAPPAKGGKDKK